MPETLLTDDEQIYDQGLPTDQVEAAHAQGESAADGHAVGEVAVLAALAERPEPTIGDFAKELSGRVEQAVGSKAAGTKDDAELCHEVEQVMLEGNFFKTVQSDGYGPQDMAELHRSVREADAYIATLDAKPLRDDYALIVAENVPGDKLAQAYRLDGSVGDGGMQRWLADELAAREGQDFGRVARLVSKAYGKSAAELFASQEHQDDPVVKRLTSDPEFATILTEECLPTKLDTESNKEFSKRTDDAVFELFTESLGLPDKFADSYLDAVYNRTLLRDKKGDLLEGDDAGVNIDKMRAALEASVKNILAVGPETIVSVWKECGIRNLDRYRPDQLERMKRLVDGDPAILERLREHDVTAVFMDGSGDYNNAFKPMPDTFEGWDKDRKDSPILFFEVNGRSSVYRAMALLKRRDIKPSTIAWGSHGAPGSSTVGGDRRTFRYVNHDQTEAQAMNEKSEIPVVSIDGYKDLQHLVHDYMQPSRAIDEPEDAKGRRRFILISCSSAAPNQKVRHLEDGSRETVEESVIETLARTVDDPLVDFYGTPKSTSYEKYGNGFQYQQKSEEATELFGHDVYESVAAVKVSVDGRGGLHTSEHNYGVELRKRAA